MNLTLLFLSLQNLGTSPFLAFPNRVSVKNSKIRYSVSPFSFNVQNLYVSNSLFQYFLSNAFVLDNNEIVAQTRLEYTKAGDILLENNKCSNFKSLNHQSQNGGAIFIKNADVNIRIIYTLFDNCVAKNGGAIYCESGNVLSCERCIFKSCKAERNAFVYSNSRKTLEFRTCLFQSLGSSSNSYETSDAIGLTGNYQDLRDVNTSHIHINGYGSSFAFRSCDLVVLRFAVMADQTGKSCMWFWDMSNSEISISQIEMMRFSCYNTQTSQGGIYSSSSIVIQNSVFCDINNVFYGYNSRLRLINCKGTNAVCGQSVEKPGWQNIGGYNKMPEWPIEQFTNGVCNLDEDVPTRSALPTVTQTPTASAVATVSPHATVTPTPKCTETPPLTPPPTVTATESRSPSPSQSQSRSYYPPSTPPPTQSPTVPYPYGVYVGMSACVSFVMAIIVFFVIFFIREVSHKSSEGTVGLLEDYRNSGAGYESSASSTDPLNLDSSSSDFDYV